MKRKMIFYFVLIILVAPGFVRAETEVSGVISSSTTWVLAESPYIVTGNILVQEGVELMIEPGVVVKFRPSQVSDQGYYIRVDGILNAQGDENNPIIFTSEITEYHWGYIEFTDTSIDWDETTSIGCILSNCIIEYGGNNGSSESIRCYGSSPMIKNNIIRYSNHGAISCFWSTSYPEIISNYIYDNGGNIEIIIFSNAKIHDNIIRGSNELGIYIDEQAKHVEITNNTITNLCSKTYGNYGACIRIDIGYRELEKEILIYKNDMTSDSIISNIISLRLEGDVNFENLNFVQNNLKNTNGVFSVYFEGYNFDQTLNMTNNWWGTTNEAVIDQLIHDDNDDFNLPTVNFQPIATEEISDAGSSLPPILPYPPVANAGLDQIVFDAITLDGSLSSDPDGDPLTYEWNIQHAVNPGHNHIATGQVVTITGLALGFYDVILTVTDATGAIDTDTMFFSATGLKGDLDQDGDVDGDDLAEFSENFGM